jgi:gliding motility-associated lipoprotein GldH
VFLYSKFPNEAEKKDTLQFILAEPSGKWLGEKTGTIVEFQSMISKGGTFARSGTYSFKLQHAMREDNLNEIVDIGFRAEKQQK